LDGVSIHLRRTAENAGDIEAAVARFGPRVGLSGVLDDLNRQAVETEVPGRITGWGFRWNDADGATRRWWPQGITTSADAGLDGALGDAPDDALGGRQVVLTSAYSQRVAGVRMGARLSVVDVSDPADLRYRHVLLVEPFLRPDGSVDVRPVLVHAGGIVWHGRHLHVAGTTRGFSSFRLEDVVRVPAGDATRIGVRDGSPGSVDTFGHRYVLPVRFTYDGLEAHGTTRMRYSFASLDHTSSPRHLVAGEYGRSSMSSRLVRYEVDPETSLLRVDERGSSRPVELQPGGVPGMQGAAVVDDTWFVTTSRGRYRLGSVWVGRPGALVEHRNRLPVGPEDVTYWPGRDELWSLSEYPGARYVFAMPREQLR
jgi:hypothetical protein